MGIWTSRPIALEPFVFLSRWQVMETDGIFRHSIGHNVEAMSEWASTPIDQRWTTVLDPQAGTKCSREYNVRYEAPPLASCIN